MTRIGIKDIIGIAVIVITKGGFGKIKLHQSIGIATLVLSVKVYCTVEQVLDTGDIGGLQVIGVGKKAVSGAEPLGVIGIGN